MAVFQDEYFDATEKMADAVMEYAAQFIAQDYLEEYRSADEDSMGAFMSSTFETEMEAVLKKASVKPIGHWKKNAKRAMCGVGTVWIGLSSVLFLVILIVAPLRRAVTEFVMQLF